MSPQHLSNEMLPCFTKRAQRLIETLNARARYITVATSTTARESSPDAVFLMKTFSSHEA